MALVMLFYYKEKVTFVRSDIALCLGLREKKQQKCDEKHKNGGKYNDIVI